MDNKILIYHFLASTEIGGAIKNVSVLNNNINKKNFTNIIIAPVSKKEKKKKRNFLESPNPNNIFKYTLFCFFLLLKLNIKKQKTLISTHGRGCGFLVRPIAILFNFKIFHTFRGFDKNFGYQNLSLINKLKIFFLIKIEKILSRKSFCICVSKSELQAVKKNLEIKKAFLIYNPAIEFKFRKNIKKKIDFLIVGRRSYQKGYDIFLDLMTQRPLLNIHWLGDKKKDEIFSLIDNKIRENVYNSSDPSNYLSKSKFLLILSRWEGASTICIEALKSGVPVISLNCQGVNEFINFTKAGYIINSRKEIHKILLYFSKISYKKFINLKKKTFKINKLVNIKKTIHDYERLYKLGYNNKI